MAVNNFIASQVLIMSVSLSRLLFYLWSLACHICLIIDLYIFCHLSFLESDSPNCFASFTMLTALTLISKSEGNCLYYQFYLGFEKMNTYKYKYILILTFNQLMTENFNICSDWNDFFKTISIVKHHLLDIISWIYSLEKVSLLLVIIITSFKNLVFYLRKFFLPLSYYIL